MVDVYEEGEVVDIVLEVVNYIDRHDEQFDLMKSEEHVLPWSVEAKARKVSDEYGRDKSDVKNDVNLSNRSLAIESDLDENFIAEVIEYIENQDISKSEVLGGLKLQANSSGGRPSKVDKWADKIESGEANLEDARENMSDPTWYKLKERVEE